MKALRAVLGTVAFMAAAVLVFLFNISCEPSVVCLVCVCVQVFVCLQRPK